MIDGTIGNTRGEELANKGGNFDLIKTPKPVIEQIFKEVLNRNHQRGSEPVEEVAMDAAIQNLKRWCERF